MTHVVRVVNDLFDNDHRWVFTASNPDPVRVPWPHLPRRKKTR